MNVGALPVHCKKSVRDDEALLSLFTGMETLTPRLLVEADRQSFL